jgi:hypothetical protein
VEEFDQRFRTAVRTRTVSRELRGLLENAFESLGKDPRSLKSALEELFMFLTTPDGRTDANCCATDAFFSAIDESDERLQRIPPSLRNLVMTIGGALHDSVYAPHIASNFDSLPEQLLQRVRDTTIEPRS